MSSYSGRAFAKEPHLRLRTHAIIEDSPNGPVLESSQEGEISRRDSEQAYLVTYLAADMRAELTTACRRERREEVRQGDPKL